MILDATLRDAILREARAAVPRECCGLLEGDGWGDDARIVAIHPSRNLADADDRFEIDPALQFRLMREGRRIVGCYHSHPNGVTVPSPRDAEGAQEAGFLWIIAAGDALAAFVWDGAAFVPAALTMA
ncbi:MAG TPA: M67 family metallopeptidase [Rhizomicrobium sp.]|nr:M67 family metallopeptidase [Rhizomicrobium sp.]